MSRIVFGDNLLTSNFIISSLISWSVFVVTYILSFFIDLDKLLISFPIAVGLSSLVSFFLSRQLALRQVCFLNLNVSL